MVPFRFQRLELPDIIVIEPTVFEDDRGMFMEAYPTSDFLSAGLGDPLERPPPPPSRPAAAAPASRPAMQPCRLCGRPITTFRCADSAEFSRGDGRMRVHRQPLRASAASRPPRLACREPGQA